MAHLRAVKQAAKLVLTDDNFASIKAAVEEGRGVFDNLTKFIVWIMPTNLGEALLLITAIFLGLPLPVVPVYFSVAPFITRAGAEAAALASLVATSGTATAAVALVGVVSVSRVVPVLAVGAVHVGQPEGRIASAAGLVAPYSSHVRNAGLFHLLPNQRRLHHAFGNGIV